MTTKMKTKWRLSKLPTPDELAGLVQAKIIKPEEAHEILITQETEDDRDKESLQSEIKFLRELIAKLANNKTEVIRTIEYIEKPYRNYGWYGPYLTYCTSGSNTLTSTGGSSYTTTATAGLASSDITYLATTGTANTATLTYSSSPDESAEDFKAIATF